jgi:hypothetical protein
MILKKIDNQLIFNDNKNMEHQLIFNDIKKKWTIN